MTWNRPSEWRSTAAIVAAVVLSCVVSGCAPPSPPTSTETGGTMWRFSGPTLGTSYSVKIVATTLEETEQAAIQEAIETELETVDAAMSTYRDDSELTRFNRYGGADPMVLSVATFTVLAEAARIGDQSGGAFDVTVGPLVNALGFGPDDEVGGRKIDDTLLDALRDRVGWDKLEIDQGDRSVAKSHPAVYVDLGAIAKGYAVDRISDALASRGYDRFMVEVGGEVRTAGVNAEGEAWRIGVERPETERAGIVEVVPLRDRAMATSGDYRNYREIDGRRISHIIDPRTARSIRHRLASTTVVSDRCATADGWATALMVLGPEEGMKVAREEKLAVLMLVREDDGFRHIR
ncbi:MAG: FAD:protein FMN transferase, partial [Acidobacteriota bacterium]